MSPVVPRAEAGTSIVGFQKGHIVERPTDPDSLILEAWAQGFMVGALVIMSFITVANMRRGVLLHKLILGLWQGFWLFFRAPVYAWWLSVSAIFLNASWSLHNVIAWIKIKPFLSRPVSLIFIGTVILVQPYWVVEIYANFAYFHGVNKTFLKTRPWEALCRDPWWIFTTVALFWNIQTRYEMTLKEITRISPRFAIMLGAMVLSIIFIVLDICSVTGAFKSSLPVGINPFWKLAFVFKCLTDSVVLDDFKTALDRLRAFKISRLGSFSGDMSDRRTHNGGSLVNTWEEMEAEARVNRAPVLPSPEREVKHAHFPDLFPHRSHKDSVIAPMPQFSNRSSSNNSISPEDIVSSAIEDPPRTLENAHFAKDRQTGWRRSSHESDHIAELDYGAALRDMEGYKPHSSPLKTTFSRRSNPP
ncbi:hypothetical protein P154DRAFT_586700 [Amniculicola lignicola CBS 123094]|uniref:Uncharacterized protein n=1 Tax=Amniculicola lignicola CBS 123094 TaxID=1392246 RepID=A0A6A5VYS3_9PLEO|nr:hypothetical protein P154DRAFT_586700 [Amniculicola lignicola CBS 123094]